MFSYITVLLDNLRLDFIATNPHFRLRGHVSFNDVEISCDEPRIASLGGQKIIDADSCFWLRRWLRVLER